MSGWDSRFMAMAQLVAGWSKDPSTGTGAVIVDRNRVVSVGFNGFPRGIADDDRRNDRSLKYEMTVHAEVNAILFAQRPVNGFTMYAWPLSPCARCASVIVQSGIARLVSQIVTEPRWIENCTMAANLLREGGVIVDLREAS